MRLLFGRFFGLFFKWKEILSMYAASEREQKEKEMEICIPLLSQVSNTDVSEPALPHGTTVNSSLMLKRTD